MVSTITPGAAGANAFAVDQRLPRPGAQTAQQQRQDAAQGDRVELSGASIAASRESVRSGLTQVHEALALGHDAQVMLVNVQGLSRAGGSQAELDATLSAYNQRLEGSAARDGALANGKDLVVQAEPGAAPVTIAGVDLQLGGSLISVSADASITDPALGQNVQKSLDALQTSMNGLVDSARALEAHQGFLSAAETAANVRTDLNADSARLMALQVRQGLETVGNAPIANVEPQAVLSLFRA